MWWGGKVKVNKQKFQQNNDCATPCAWATDQSHPSIKRLFIPWPKVAHIIATSATYAVFSQFRLFAYFRVHLQ